MVLVRVARVTDRDDVERLIASYHCSEGIKPNADRISWAVTLSLRNRRTDLLMVALHETIIVGVALAVYSPSAELGRVLTVNDFYVDRKSRRRGIGRALARRLLAEAKKRRMDLVVLEVLPKNRVAAIFWKSLGFRTEGRTVYGRGV